MELDLVQIQQSAKKIKNPFGFDFTAKWAGKPITLPGDNKWYPVIAPLADHLANRLYMKIRYQFHDEQVAALKAKGDFQGARAYAVPAEIENKIWMLITGYPKHATLPTADGVNDEADLTVLRQEMKALEKKAGTGGIINVTKILEKATVEALPTADAVDGKNASGHVAGAATLAEQPVVTSPVDTTPVSVADLPTNPTVLPAEQPATQEATPSTQPPAEGEFQDLNELDQNGTA